jgi:hypothetical protein
VGPAAHLRLHPGKLAANPDRPAGSKMRKRPRPVGGIGSRPARTGGPGLPREADAAIHSCHYRADAGNPDRAGRFDHVDPSSAPEAPAGPHRSPRGPPGSNPAVSPDKVTRTPLASTTLYPQETAAAEVAARVLGAAVRPSDTAELTLIYPDGRLAAIEEATLGDRADLRLAHLRRESDMQWPAPARWWWQVAIHDARWLPRLREVFPVAARACEAADVRRPGDLPAGVIMTVPDLHWLVHTRPAQLLGHPTVLNRAATVTLGPGRSPDRGMASVVAALPEWLGSEAATRARSRLDRRRAAERQLYLTIGCTEFVADALDALARADGVPPATPPEWLAASHLWLAPVLGPAVFLWSRDDGWSRHEPYG